MIPLPLFYCVFSVFKYLLFITSTYIGLRIDKAPYMLKTQWFSVKWREDVCCSVDVVNLRKP